jgi:hypothetical protein
MISGKGGDAIPWIMVLLATSLIIFIKDKIVHVLITINFCKQKKVLSQESKGDVVVRATNSHGGNRWHLLLSVKLSTTWRRLAGLTDRLLYSREKVLATYWIGVQMGTTEGTDAPGLAPHYYK